ncbi:hypothetical protein JNUCC0626_44585 [Lentzea sp. JNUCC 0626]|uniref:hypothetical protein n=1 Tax=Lentzea sp. JNUCC 0626 TaxID=3367513 RepID=UPI0037482761
MGELQYQDLVNAGGLEAVLRQACPGSDNDLRDARGAFGGQVATVSRGDRAVSVLPWHEQRRFYLRHILNGTHLSYLTTIDLAEVTSCTAVWLGGATPRELAVTWPFADFVEVADAYASGDGPCCRRRTVLGDRSQEASPRWPRRGWGGAGVRRGTGPSRGSVVHSGTGVSAVG